MTENSTEAPATAPAPATPTEPAPSEAPSSSTSNSAGGRGRGRGRGGRGRGGRGGRNRSRNPRTNKPSTKTATFKGNTEGMNGHVFQCHSEDADKKQFLRTVGVLGEYINKTFTYPADVASICKSFKVIPLVQPANLTKEEYATDIGKKMIWETKMKTYMRREDQMESNLRAIYSIVWGQCSTMMQSKVESLEDYETKSTACDCVWLLEQIRKITHQFEGTKLGYVSLMEAWEVFVKYRQSGDQSLHEYLKDFQALVQVLEHYRAPLGEGPVYEEMELDRLKETYPDLTDAQVKSKCKSAAKQRFIGIAFLQHADKKRYGALWSELQNNFTRGLNQYPLDLTGAYNMLLIYEPPPTHRNAQREQRNNPSPNDEDNQEDGVSAVSFLQNSVPTPGNDGITRPRVRCYNCQGMGHYADECPNQGEEGARTGSQFMQQGTVELDSTGVQMLQNNANNDKQDEDPKAESEDDPDSDEGPDDDGDVSDDDEPNVSAFSFMMLERAGGHSFQQQHGGPTTIPKTWILLDSQSTVSVFNNRRYLKNIRKSPTVLTVHTNGGTQVSKEVGQVKDFGDVWFNKHSLANILSLAEVRKVCRITMDTSVEAAIIVHRKDGTEMKFREYHSGLYYFDVEAQEKAKTNHSSKESQDYWFLNTVAGNKERYTRREIAAADQARALYRKLTYPSETDFQQALDKNLVRNCPVTSDDARRALTIYGPDTATLKGRTVKKKNKAIGNTPRPVIPAPIILQYRELRLFVDIFWVNGSPYFHTISEWIKFRTVAPIKNRTRRTLLMETRAVVKLYQTRGFTVTRVEGDQEFLCMENDLLPTTVNIADADDHVHEAERSIRVIKERTRCIVQGIPFRRIPKIMMRSAIEAANKSLNQFPVRDGVSDTMSPLTIVTRKPLPNYRDLKLAGVRYLRAGF